MIDDPERALVFIMTCNNFILDPRGNLRFDVLTHSFEETQATRFLPESHRPRKPEFPIEIGRFLFTKLTYAPSGLRACNILIDLYDEYDLRKITRTLNEAITTNNTDIINKSAEDFSTILDNIWQDKTLPRRIKGLQIGIPLSMVVLGNITAGPIGVMGGFLAGLGYNIADKLVDLGTESISEKLAKLRTKNYQTNIYDFKRKNKDRIVLDTKNNGFT
jgi:hypothetical protein